MLLAYVFGSWAKGDAPDESDADVAVLLKDDSWKVLSRLMDTVASTFDVDVEKVDLRGNLHFGKILANASSIYTSLRAELSFYGKTTSVMDILSCIGC